MEAALNLIFDLATKLIALFSAGDAEAERQAMLHLASRLSDEAFKRASGK